MDVQLLTTSSTELARIEHAMFRALEEDKQVTPVPDTQPGWKMDAAATPVSLQELSPTENEEMTDLNVPRLTRLQMNGQRNVNQGRDRPRHASASSDSMASASDASLYGGDAPASPMSQNTNRSLSPGTRVNINHRRGQREHVLYNGLNNSRAVDQIFRKDAPSVRERGSVDQTYDLTHADYGRRNVVEAVASAMHQLHQLRLQEQGARPIRYEPQNQTHKPDADTIKIFEVSVNEELRIRRLVTRDWLRVATWWLLKARVTLANSDRHTYVSARGNTSPSTESKSTSHQAYVDLLKASYILYEVVLKDESSSALMTDENRKSIADLSEVSSQGGSVPTFRILITSRVSTKSFRNLPRSISPSHPPCSLKIWAYGSRYSQKRHRRMAQILRLALAHLVGLQLIKKMPVTTTNGSSTEPLSTQESEARSFEFALKALHTCCYLSAEKEKVSRRSLFATKVVHSVLSENVSFNLTH